ncbi:Uncharacterized conserved protein YehS, DUF1456 family [Psychroflexus salarius]|uniref:Uncharacterized conserved protein YehS, DUF1456 family n=1 Tax=Psychroflexus salarius TaxID=1155689 RepID=A0A1M4XY60_9FLAO|nr:DUF1456 family protein [Psychroflexus salarius]SHE98253.1 Uncharacterized conserved protein YehS, DUF1456 family [Psychroflexus salarius]
MTNNDVLRRLRYTFDFSDDEMIRIFDLGDYKTTRTEISDWLKPEDHASYINLPDKKLAHFLNGFINLKRGKREGEQPTAESTMTNNLVLKKLKIALALKTEDLISIFKQADLEVSKNEISAFMRNPKQSQYRQLLDQYLRNFLMGLQLRYRT